MGPDSPTDLLQAGAVLLFTTFHQSSLVTKTDADTLRRLFGPYPASAATRACEHVQTLVAWLPEEELEVLVAKATGSHENQQEFGHSIKFHDPEPIHTDVIDWLDSDDESDDEGLTFDMRYIQNNEPDTKDDKISASWLRQQVEKHFGPSPAGMSIVDMCNSIFDTLSSSKSDDELQEGVRMSAC